MVLQIARITKDRPDLLPLLEQAYHDIYVPAFPDKNEREGLDKIQKAIDGKYESVHVVVNILGENLDDPKNKVIKGISIGYYFEKQNVGLLAYNAIDPAAREKGLGKLMVDSRIEAMKDIAQSLGKKLGGVFIEANDPAKVSPEHDSMDPAKRISLFEKWGARKIPLDYVQPPVSKHDDYSENLLLLNYPLDGKYADKKTVEDYLRAVYRDFRTDFVKLENGETKQIVLRAEHDYFFNKMKKQLDDTKIDVPAAPAVPGYKIGVPKFNRLTKPGL